MRSRAGFTKFGCLVYMLVVAAVLYFGIPVGEMYFRNLEYQDAMRQELRFRSGLPNERIKRNLQIVADSLGLPAKAGEVTITRKDNRISVVADYEEIIHLPGFVKVIRFKPRADDTY